MTLKDATISSWAAIVAFVQSLAHRAVEGVLVLGVGVVTWNAFWWAMTYATAALVEEQDPLGTAAVLGAILTPLGVLQGFTLKQFLDHKE